MGNSNTFSIGESSAAVRKGLCAGAQAVTSRGQKFFGGKDDVGAALEGTKHGDLHRSSTMVAVPSICACNFREPGDPDVMREVSLGQKTTYATDCKIFKHKMITGCLNLWP